MAFNFEDDNDNVSETEGQQPVDDGSFGTDDFYTDGAEGGAPPEESNNRTFIIIAAILGVLIVITLICMGIFAATKLLPSLTTAQNSEATRSAIAATNQAEMINQSLTETAGAPTPTGLFPPTATPSPKPAATKTPVLAASVTPTSGGIGAETATVIALKTQLAAAQLTKLPTSTALPQGGFADEVGAPGLVGLAIVLVVIIFVVRRLRSG